jgi:hypothetical protein
MRRAAFVGAAALAAAGFAACAGGPECTKNSDCNFGSHCSAGRCYSECRGDVDCLHGLVCDVNYGRCTTPDQDGGPPPPPPQTDGPAQLPDAAPQTDAPPVHTDGPLPQTDGPVTGTGNYPDSCQADGQCATNQCLPPAWSTPGRSCLLSSCATNSQCQMGDVCLLAKAPVNHATCVPQDSGKPCTDAHPEVCVGFCLTNALLGNGVCTTDCSSAADCPAGDACYPISTGSGSATICFPPDPTPCTGATQLECRIPGYQACIGDPSNPPGRCLNPCRTVADCPAGSTCEAVGGLSLTYCIPPSLGAGLIGTSCGGDGNQCRSGLCLGTYCTEKCGVTRGAQACPIGFGCAAVPDGSGGWTLACVQSGAGDFGASCTDQSGCRSALCVGAPGFCSKFCNDGAPCPTGTTCQDVATTADGLALKACGPP